LQGRKTGAWISLCNFMIAKPFKAQPSSSQKAELSQIGKELYVFNFDTSKKSYLLMKESVLEIDKEIQSILDKTKLYLLKIPIDIKGFYYDLGDFVVSIGSVFLKDQAKGTIVEVEYKPSYSVHSQCHKLLDEFLGYLGPFDADVQQYLTTIDNATNMETTFMQNTVLQYVNVFKCMGILASKS